MNLKSANFDSRLRDSAPIRRDAPKPPVEGLMPKKSQLVPAKPAYYATTTAGFPLDPDGVAVWDPIIRSGPIRPSIIPTTQPISHAVMIILKFWAALPSTHKFHITTKQEVTAVESSRGKKKKK